MATVHDAYVAVSEEVAYGVAVLPARAYEFVSESLLGKYERVESKALRAGTRVMRSDRFVPTAKGAEGDLALEVFDKGFGLILKHMLGTLTVTAGSPTIMAATVGPLLGKALTVQVGRVDVSGNSQPFTYSGCKVASWELSNTIDSVLNLSVSLDAQAEKAGAGAGAFAAVVPTFPAGQSLMTFVGGSVLVAGSNLPVSECSLKGDNGLKTDRWFLGNTKKEPLEDAMRAYTFDLKAEFDGLTQYNRVAAATATGALAVIQLVWASGTNSLTVDIPAGRFDQGKVAVDGVQNIDQALSGVCLFDGTNSPVTLTYRTADLTA